MIATSALNRDVFDFFGKWESDRSLSVLPKAKRSDPKTGTVVGAAASLESVTGTRARQRSRVHMSVMLKKKGVFDAKRPARCWLFLRSVDLAAALQEPSAYPAERMTAVWRGLYVSFE